MKYENAADYLAKNRDTSLASSDLPAEHWKNPHTPNPIESTFAAVRHRTIRSKDYLLNKTALAMVFKLARGCAQELTPPRWSRSVAKADLGCDVR